ncbi:MAG: AIPR family protein [Bacteroidetes bacterium]|nr:AIPR family protein [Bacteroidota bacterium]
MMLSDKTDYSDKVGRKNRAEVIVTNPQIINGGQTAYTLSIIYEECIKNSTTIDIFNNKEVLLKIITFSDENTLQSTLNGNRLKLIEDISIATNQQSPVTEADRRANDKVQVELQRAIFKEFGLYYERKRGEYEDGLRKGYIDSDEIIDRELFLRICLSAQNNPSVARRSGQGKLFNKNTFDDILPNISAYRKYVFVYKTYEKIPQISGSFGNAVSYRRYAVTSVIANKFTDDIKAETFDEVIERNLKMVLNKWLDFESFARNQKHNEGFFTSIFDSTTGQRIVEANWNGYYKGGSLIGDLNSFFKLGL